MAEQKFRALELQRVIRTKEIHEMEKTHNLIKSEGAMLVYIFGTKTLKKGKLPVG